MTREEYHRLKKGHQHHYDIRRPSSPSNYHMPGEATGFEYPKHKIHLPHYHRYAHHHWFRTIGIILVVILALYGVDGIMSAHHFQQNSYDANNPSTTAEGKLDSHQPISVLMMGTDTGALGRHEKRGRTDTIMLNTINPQKQSMELTSIPRDTPAHYDNTLTKINSVYTLGGAQQTQKYIQDWLGVPVNYYMLINMGGLANIINKVGGVTITPTRTFKYGDANVKKGQTVNLNGMQALDYCRMRHQDPLGDYGRQIRQRQVLFQLFNKITKVHNLFLHPSLADALSDNVKTNLSSNDLMKLMMFYRHANRHHISTHLQGKTTQINGQDFEQIPVDERQKQANQILNNLRG